MYINYIRNVPAMKCECRLLNIPLSYIHVHVHVYVHVYALLYRCKIVHISHYVSCCRIHCVYSLQEWFDQYEFYQFEVCILAFSCKSVRVHVHCTCMLSGFRLFCRPTGSGSTWHHCPQIQWLISMPLCPAD